MPEAAAGHEDPKTFKSQPWILFDTIVADSFLIGDGTPAGLAVGGTIPAINSNGEMVFFTSSGRNTANTPWYTNLDQQSTLSYGLEVWQAYLLLAFPAVTPNQNNGFDPTLDAGVPPTTKLMEALLNFGVIEMELGQENQTRWPCTRFGAGGGLSVSNTAAVVVNNNAIPEGANVMKLPEPIEMPRTQNLSVKLRIAPEARGLIGTVAAPGVGTALVNYSYRIQAGEGVNTVSLKQLPFMVQFGLVGRRIKKTQYGQIPG